ncbi:glycosyltransferase [Actinokineospora sp. G85]|uniref:glycosyltransferase n=1 Tax=Actinokineospora sp. G85 TaxID=3406626 RepID=UPI003C750337
MIAYYAHHHGSGHRHRATAIARRLSSPVIGLSSAERPADWPGEWVRLSEDAAGVDPVRDDATAAGLLHWAPVGHPGHLARTHAISAVLATRGVRLLVADVSAEVAVLARLHGVPVVVMAQPGARTDPAHLLAYGLARRLLAPWPARPQPDWPPEWLAKTTHLGAVSRFDPAPGGPVRERHVLVLWGSGGLDVSADQLRAAASATPGWSWEVAGPRAPSTGADPSNLRWLGWVADPWAALRSAGVVVTHAGQNAVAEVAAARRPAVVVPQERPFGEQHATAGALDRAGLAVVSPTWPDPAAWPAALDRAARLGGEAWSSWSDGRGADRAAAELEALARR